MRTVDIVIRLKGHQQEMELEIGERINNGIFYAQVQKAVADQAAVIVYKGDYFRYDQNLLPHDDKEFSTYVLFRNIVLNDTDDNDLIWQSLAEHLKNERFPEVREKNSHHQLIELSSLNEDFAFQDKNNTENFEDILVRVPGTREELEFDPSGPEANKILYDKLAKLIYNREAEIMYKGPRLIFEENRDLFINADDFSIYVLFRSDRDYNYENNEQLWNNLKSDLMILTSISLYKSADNYQVILFKHDL
ncbi:hypothetical protein [Flavobacterium sp. NRK1]|uniref:hypothetical protein n=1 Tax=Flavobacterium sp. NRK1 TaxID=2954929 RepID=UPI002093A9BC|nr:hypothetical protein [Flavobacterium sp. NRK1]MCO6149465.1 hypothetical protein [Flavobacterium sp. NRK1]